MQDPAYHPKLLHIPVYLLKYPGKPEGDYLRAGGHDTAEETPFDVQVDHVKVRVRYPYIVKVSIADAQNRGNNGVHDKLCLQVLQGIRIVVFVVEDHLTKQVRNAKLLA